MLEALASPKTGRLSSDLVDKVRRDLKIVQHQVQLCYELAWRHALLAHEADLRTQAGQVDGDEAATTKFRQSVKKRLYFDREEELDRNSPDFKQRLDDLFADEVRGFDAAVRKIYQPQSDVV